MGLQAIYCSHQFLPRAYRFLSVIFVGLGVAEVDQDPVAHVVRDEASEALNGLRDPLLVGRNDLAEVFRVHACRQCR